MTIQFNAAYRRTGAADGIDWNYVTTAPCVFEFTVPDKELWTDGCPARLITFAFKNEWLTIVQDPGDPHHITVTVAAAYAFDGASVVPDYDGVVDGSLPHDAFYQFVDEIAGAWGCGAKRVMAFADLRFKDVMAYNGVPPAVYRTYYSGVAVFGWLFNRACKFLRRKAE